MKILRKTLQLSLTIFILLSTASCTIHSCNVKVAPSVKICDITCSDTDGIYSINKIMLDSIEGKITCKFNNP